MKFDIATLQALGHRLWTHPAPRALLTTLGKNPLATGILLLVFGIPVYSWLLPSKALQATQTLPAQPPQESALSRVQEARKQLQEQKQEAQEMLSLRNQVAAQEKLVKQMQADRAKEEQERKREQEQQAQREQQAKELVQKALAAAQQARQDNAAARGKPAPRESTPARTPTAAQPTTTPAPKSGLRVVTFEKETTPVPQPTTQRGELPRLGMGCQANGKVVTGVVTSSRAGGNKDMLLSITEPFHCPYWLHGPGANPQQTEVPIQGCLALAKAVGDLASSRVEARVDYLACVMPDKTAFEEPIKGYITDADNTAGVVGEVTHHASAQEAKAFLTALLQEASAALGLARSKLVVTSVTGAVQPFQGVQTGLQQLTSLYIQQMELLVPTLWVRSQTPIRVIITEGVNLPGFPLILTSRGAESR